MKNKMLTKFIILKIKYQERNFQKFTQRPIKQIPQQTLTKLNHGMQSQQHFPQHMTVRRQRSQTKTVHGKANSESRISHHSVHNFPTQGLIALNSQTNSKLNPNTKNLGKPRFNQELKRFQDHINDKCQKSEDWDFKGQFKEQKHLCKQRSYWQSIFSLLEQKQKLIYLCIEIDQSVLLFFLKKSNKTFIKCLSNYWNLIKRKSQYQVRLTVFIITTNFKKPPKINLLRPKMTSISQSKYHNRGPLIAVIKIELDSQNVDRIFLHLKDNDEALAEQFIEKHGLNPMLKRHIHQRIQISRQAVDKNQLKYNYSESEIQDKYEQSHSFATPLQKRNSKDQRESSIRKINPIYHQQPKQQIKQKISQPYITYTESSQNQQTTNTFEENIHGQFSNKKQTTYQEQKRQNFMLENSSYEINQQPNRSVNNGLSNYITKNKYKNLYDVSGLKLKNAHSSSNKEVEWNGKFKQEHKQCTSSQSSQGLFEKEISNKKESNSKNQFDLNELSNEKIHLKRNFSDALFIENGFRKQAIPQFNEISQHQDLFQKQLHKPNSLLNSISNSKNNSISFKSSQNPLLKPFTSFNRQNQTKFSSIQKSEESDFTDLNYISFNKPYNELPSAIMHKNLKNYEGSLSQIQQNQNLFDHVNSYKDNHTNAELISKRAGSIRSNTKLSNTDFQPLFQVTKSQAHGFVPNNAQTFTPYSDLETTTRFSQEKLFNNIRDIQVSSKNLQQNRQHNTSQQTSRPAVKFYNKEEMKSLKQSNLSQTSRSMSKSQLSKINKEVTNRLYNEAQIKRKYLDTLKARAKNIEEQQQEDIEELKQKPDINLLSKLLAENRIKESKKLEDHLIDQGRMLELKRQQMANRQVRKQLQQCSFRPHINEESQRLSTLQRSRSKSRVTLNHSEIKCSKRTYNCENTFRPEINKLSSQIAKGKGSFEERQHAFLEEKNSKLFQKLQQQRIKEKTDSSTGQTFFQPQLTERTYKLAKSSLQQRQKSKPVHNYLYQLSKIPKVEQKLNPKPFINPESQKLIRQLHQKRLNWLFLELDNDEDGIISSKKICIDQIPTEILEIIAPVLYEMEELNTELNIDDFKCAIKNLNKGLDPYQKSMLYNYSHSVKAIRT